MSDETTAESVSAPDTTTSAPPADPPAPPAPVAPAGSGRASTPRPASTAGSGRPSTPRPASSADSAAAAGADPSASATTDPTPAAGTDPSASASAGADPAPGAEADRPAGGEGQPGANPARKRRRGSRGGRNRKKPGAGAGAATRADADGDDEPGRGSNERAAAERGLTTEDLAESAMEDAGLRAPRVGDTRPVPTTPPPRPRIGDTRPAPGPAGRGGDNGAETGPGGSTGAKRRRRRGGRGRTKSGSGAGPTSAPTRRNDGEVVTAALEEADDSFLEALDDETLERRRGRTRKGRPTGRYQMVVHRDDDGVTQMAVLEGRVLVEHYVSRPEDDATSIDGNIYLGKVQNVLPGMEAAFVDISTPKNGVLYRGDVQFDESEVEESAPKIERLLKNGQSVMVQVTKNPIGAKGARLTQEVSLAGRFVVMVPGQPKTYGISKRLPDDERKRLRKVLEGIRPQDAGLIVRTAAEGATPEELERDLARLQSQWEQISQLAQRSKPAKLLYQEPALVVRLIREEFTKEYRSVVIDDPDLYEQVKGYVAAIAPELAERVELYDDPDLPAFERFHVHEQLHKALDRKVWLPSGGSLIIERTEALTVIDVNTGKNVGKSNLEETVFANNLEAAEEVARQLRLRDIGGIIVIDFIDMEIRKNRDEVLKAFKAALARDKTRTQVFEISELGLVEMTRKRISEGLVEAFSETCPTCTGRGFLVDDSML
jgi:ribonuclease E